jgi:hypothetical protein
MPPPQHQIDPSDVSAQKTVVTFVCPSPASCWAPASGGPSTAVTTSTGQYNTSYGPKPPPSKTELTAPPWKHHTFPLTRPQPIAAPLVWLSDVAEPMTTSDAVKGV